MNWTGSSQSKLIINSRNMLSMLHYLTKFKMIKLRIVSITVLLHNHNLQYHASLPYQDWKIIVKLNQTLVVILAVIQALLKKMILELNKNKNLITIYHNKNLITTLWIESQVNKDSQTKIKGKNSKVRVTQLLIKS